MDLGRLPPHERDDDFNPEDVFKLFPTSFQVVPEVPEIPDVTTIEPTPVLTTSLLNSSFTLSDTWIFGEAEDQIVLPILLCIIGVCALFGNGLVASVIIGLRRMRTGPNLMLLNVTMSDLVFILFTLPTAIVNHVTIGGLTYSSGMGICKFVHYVMFVCVYVTIYTMVVTCVFRFFSDCSSGKHRAAGALLSRGNALVSCFVIWLAFLTSHLNLVLRKEGAVFQEPFICVHTDAMTDMSRVRTLWITFLACAFLLPLLSVCVLSAAILNQHRQGKCVGYDDGQSDRVVSRELTMVIMGCVVSRVACWMPIQIFVMVDIFGNADASEMYRKVEMVAVCIAFLGATVNPLIYSCLSSQFNQAFRQVLGRHKPGSRYVGQPCGGRPMDNACVTDMNETILSIMTDSSNHINYT